MYLKPSFLFQLTFDTFTVGKFVSFTSDGCPDGHMTIVERSPSPPLGQWCGSAWGYTVYFSESDSINMTLRLDRLSQQVSYLHFMQIVICSYSNAKKVGNVFGLYVFMRGF